MQTPAGIKKMQTTIRKRYGLTEDGRSIQHVNAGRLGDTKSRGGGFSSKVVGSDGLTGKERASVYGAIGGRVSRRWKKKAL